MSESDDFEVLYRSTCEDLLRFFLRRVSEPADAADLLSEVFVVAWRRRGEVRGEPRLWLFGVARRVLAAHRRGRLVGQQLAERLKGQVVEQYEASYGDLHVREVLDALPDGDRELLELVVYEQLTPAEIAVVLGRSPGSVRVRLHRARRRLQALDAAAGERRPAPVSP